MELKRHIVILALYGALTLLMTVPLLANISTHFAGMGGDPWQTMWRFENEWQTFDFVRLFGGGEARLVNISVWPWMWLHVMFGQPAAYNIVWLLSFVLSGYFIYLLVRYLTKHEVAAFLAGVLYMFLPFHVAHAMGHFGAMQTQWLPLAALLVFMWVKQPTLWRTVGLAAVIALQSWSEHHYVLWLLIFGVVFLLFYLIRPADESAKERSVENQVRWNHGVLLCVLIFVFAALPWWPMARLAAQPSNNLSLGAEQTIWFSADLFSYITPPQWQPIWGAVSHELFGRHFTGNVVEATQFLGFLPLLLLLFFREHIPRRQKVFWFIVAGIFFVISLGPRLHVFGSVLALPLPYALLNSLPVFSAVRAVARAGVFVGLAISILFGWVLATQLKRPISAGVVLAVILAEFLFLPVPLQATKLSRAYEAIANLPGKSLIEIPAATNYTAASEALYASRIHGKEVIGNIALERALEKEVFAEAKALPALRQLLFLRSAHLLEDRKEFFEQDLTETFPDVMQWLDSQTSAVQVDSLSATQRKAIEHFLEERVGLVPEEYEDVAVYRTRTTPGVDSDGVFLARDGRWENVGYDPKRESTFGEIPREAEVTVYNVRDREVTVVLEFDVEAGSVRVFENVGNAGTHMRVLLTLSRGKQEVVFESLLPGKAIIRDPKLIVR